MDMRKLFVVPTAVVLGALALGATACGSSAPSAAATAAKHKTDFCNANDKIDKASANVTSVAGFLTVLKTHKTALRVMERDAPAGTVGKDARAEVKAGNAAIAANNANSLLSTPNYGGAVDTYCGVDGNGAPLPSYFATGKGTPICTVNNSINQGTQNASSAAQVYAFLAAHQSLVNQFATYVPGLPTSIRSDAQTLVTTAKAAIAAKNPGALGSPAVGAASMNMSLYCGQNE
jgi:hypothetical protein